MEESTMHILLTNDDGIQALGLRALYRALLEAGHTVDVVAPTTEQSAVGHAVTIAMPLRVKLFNEESFKGYGVHGTPSDCVKLALTTLLTQKPDMVLSGINAGANVGPDILYSGTVAAATEAAHLGYKAMAISFDSFLLDDVHEQAAHAMTLLPSINWKALPPRCVLNVNYPNIPFKAMKGVRVCPQTHALWHDWYEERRDPRGNPYWWIDGVIDSAEVEDETDRAFLTKGYCTVTPLRFVFTDAESIDALKNLVE